MIIVLLGPPGAGKGTQGERIAERLGIPKIATGDVLRTALRDGTTLGLEARAFMERGDLVPDRVILGIMKEAMDSEAAAGGAILDGVVRTVPQAQGLALMLAELGKKVQCVLLFKVDDDELVARLGDRTVCGECQTPFSGKKAGAVCTKCGGTLVRRKDDEPESIRNRLSVYREQTEPVIEWFKKNDTPVLEIDAIGTLEDVTTRAMRALEQ